MTGTTVFIVVRETPSCSYPVGTFLDWDGAIREVQHRIMNCEPRQPDTNTIPAWPLSDPSKSLMGSATWIADEVEGARGLYVWRDTLQ